MLQADQSRKDSPAGEHLGRRIISSDPESGETVLEYVAKAEFTNRHGTVAGGFLAAMLDSATSIPVLSSLSSLAKNQTVVTTHLDVKFERPATVGTLKAVSRVVERTDREIQSTAELLDETGQVVARAAATLRIVSK
jgi:uncharacterized protein (TIGR00369 family)